MAKRKINREIKRVVSKSGQLYFFKGGKRITTKKGERAFAKQLVKTGQGVPADFTPKEREFFKRSEASKKGYANTYKYQGRPIPRIYAILLQKLFPKNSLDEKELYKWTKANGKPLFSRFSDIQRTIDEASKNSPDIFRVLTEMGYFKDKQGRTALIDICEIIKQKEYDKYKFILIDAEGNEIRGRVNVCEAIRQFEEEVTTDIRASLGMNVIKTYFDYSPKYDFANKIFQLDLQDQAPKISIDDIVNANKGELLIPKEIISDTGKPIKVSDKLVGKNKYKDVYITYSVS